MTTFRPPTSEQVAEALRRIPTLELRRVFFEKLNNPEWVKPLHEAGAFGAPQPPTVDDKGVIREEVWPEITYLDRMAHDRPRAVVDVLLDLKASENSWIRRGVFSIASKIPADEAARLAPVVEAWRYHLGWRTDPRDLSGMARNLLTGGQRAFGLQVADFLFRPRVDPKQERHVVSGLEDYWYSQELPGVAEAMAEDALPTLLRWLKKHEKISGHFSSKSDLTEMSRPNIASRDTISSDAKNALIDSVRDAAASGFVSQPELVVRLLTESGMVVARKIALHVAGRALREAGATASRGMRDTGLELLRDPLSADRSCRIEYAELYLALRDLGIEVESILSIIVNDGPYGDRDKLVERLRRKDEDQSTTAERATEFTLAWRHSLLATIGRNALPESLRGVLDKLDQAEGVIESPRAPDFALRSWSGPTSPVEQDDLAAKDPKELVKLLSTWVSGDAWMSPTHEGLGRELTALLASKTNALAGEAAAVVTLRPTYVRAVLSGWTQALRNGTDFDRSEAIAVIKAVLEHADESDIEPEGRDFDDDKDFAPAKQQASSLLSELLAKTAAADITTRTAAEILLASLEDGAAWARYSAGSGDGMDPLTLSLNSQWPINVDGLISLLSFGEQTPWFADAGLALERELGRDDSRGASYAVVGNGFARLFNGARPWLEAHVEQFFGSARALSRAQQIALTTALATHRVHSHLLELLRGPMKGAIELGDSIELGWRGNHSGPELLGNWIVTCLIWGELAPDDPLVQAFFSDARPTDRGTVVGRIGFEFMHAEKVDDEIRVRFEQLWDARVAHVLNHIEDNAELKDFYWLIRSGKFAVEWWLPRLIGAKQLNGSLTTQGMIGEQLAAAAPVMPAEALQALELLMGNDEDDGVSEYDLTEHALGPVIAAAIRTGEPDLQREARKFMNILGRRGIIDIQQRVNDADLSAG